MRVFLIHGMGRTSASMGLLARRLRNAGFRPSKFGYRVRGETLEDIAARFASHVHHKLDEDGADEPPRWAVVGHSLGNVITRLATPSFPTGFSCFVMLAPPNRAPVLAQRLAPNPLFRALTRDAGQRLADPAFFARLPVPDARTLVLAGTRGPRARWLPFGGAAGDGVVTVEETRLDANQVEHRQVPCIHTFIMNDWRVAREITAFLRENGG